MLPVLFLAVFSGCGGNIPLEPIIPPDSTSYIDTRTWSVPESIALISTESYPGALVFHGGRLHLLAVIPGDSLAIHDRFEMLYLVNDGISWMPRERISGLGIFKPMAIAPLNDGSIHIFWAGIRPELRESPITSNASDIFNCVWSELNSSCSNPVSVFSRSSPETFTFQGAIVDRDNTITVAFYEAPRVNILTIPKNGNPHQSLYGISLYPSLTIKSDSLLLVYVDSPDPPEGANDLYFSIRTPSSSWSHPSNAVHDVKRATHHPAVAVDKKGRIHIAWYAHLTEGPVEVRHAISSDEGKSWQFNSSIHKNNDFFSGPLALIADDTGAVHLTWSFWATLPYLNNYHSVWRDGSWSTPQHLFPDILAKTPAMISVDNLNKVHLVFANETNLFHGSFE